MEMKVMGMEQSVSREDNNRELNEVEVQKTLENELSYFEVPENLKDKVNEAVEISDFLFSTNELYSDEPQKPEGIPLKLYRSKEWTSVMKKDTDYSHPVRYYADISAISKEYLPDSLSEHFDKKWKELKLKYPLVDMPQEESIALFNRIIGNTATIEDKEIYEKEKGQKERAYEEFQKYRKAAILKSPKIEKRILAFAKPLMICGYKRERAFDRSEEGIRDIRYISQEEVDKLKTQGYDGIIYEQYNWAIAL